MKRFLAIVLALMLVLSLGAVAFADEETAEEEVVLEYPMSDDGVMVTVPLNSTYVGVFSAEGTYSDDGSVNYVDIEQVCYVLPETYSAGDTVLVHVSGSAEDSVRLFMVNSDGWSRASTITVINPGDFDLRLEIIVADDESKGVTETNQLNFKGSSYGVNIPNLTITTLEVFSGTIDDYTAAGGVNCSLTGHTITEYVSNNDATCTEDGTKTGVCSVCGEEETVTDEGTATGHSFTNYVSNNDATCTEDGTLTAECDNGCGKTDTITDEGTATGHNYEKGVCANCGAEDPDYSSFPTTAVIIFAVVVIVIAAVVILVAVLNMKKKK
ncbi:MAG: hypothetical protein LUC38_00030 [Oscillospiraceae bacterium]|nr:hypothetical protein [Oscillospiraceae bacterium]